MSENIQQLTEEQKARFPEWVEKWTKVGLSCEPGDLEKAHQAALQAYDLCGLQRPKVVLKVGSPLATAVGGAIAFAVMNGICRFGESFQQIDYAHAKGVKQSVAGLIDIGRLRKLSDKHFKGMSKNWQGLYGQVVDSLFDQLSKGAATALLSEVANKLVPTKDKARLQKTLEGYVSTELSSVKNYAREGAGNDFGGQFWAGFCSWVSFFRDVVGWRGSTLKNFEICEQLTLNCGWVWWHEEICCISDRPSSIHQDQRNRLHSDSAPAVSYRDGWNIYSIHGVRVPEQLVLHPEKITVKDIEEQSNAEVRRVMIEKYGAPRYLVDSGAREIHRDKFGILHKKEISGDEPMVMVELLNSTPEPNGSMSKQMAIERFGDIEISRVCEITGEPEMARIKDFPDVDPQTGEPIRFKTYFLRVPPDMTTARQAVAWTFGYKDAKQYEPEFQS